MMMNGSPTERLVEPQPHPALFLVLRLKPLVQLAPTEMALDIPGLVALAGRMPHLFERDWRTFPTKEEAEEHAHGDGYCLVVMPLVIEFNALLGH